MYSDKVGIFIISLDFELLWGVRDKKSIATYGDNILGVRKAIPGMLALFDQYQIKATFATVGFLMHRTKAELLSNLPEIKPEYSLKILSPYLGYLESIGRDEKEDPYHFADQLIQQILSYNVHELSCHTFSHYYCLEPGQTIDQFDADLHAAQQAAKRYDLQLKSLVFPRNQYNEEYLKVCLKNGIESYRGNQTSWLYAAKSGEQESLLRRMFRLIDTYLNISGFHVYRKDALHSSLPVNIPASRFLRPYSKKLAVIDFLKLKRIKDEMTHAAQTGGMYHLWWHPHNFGVNTNRNLSFLEQIFKHYHALKEQYGFQSNTMDEFAKSITKGN